MALPDVSEYRYWNHTDPPASISSRAWDTRGRRWHQLLGTSGVPNHSGFSITILEERLTPTYPTLQRVYRHALPPIDVRVNRLALDLTLAAIRPSSISEAHQLLTALLEGCSPHQSQFHHHQATLQRQLSQPPTLAQLQQGHKRS